ncbi:prespore protein Dp87-like [Pollicipes pollicipes]|uniref:prespore protein Dp87-like n=1 Tax=Pollicipes pollicipes TaxID=41117 RepID=UPI00188525C5|nr:prespore protein Dp87-like [Pollicipes pollicipes]
MEHLRCIAGLLLLLWYIGQLESSEPVSAPKRISCVKLCPKGQRCELRRRCSHGFCFDHHPVCVKSPAPVKKRHPSCQNVRCRRLQTCVLRQVLCIGAPCYPVPVCIPDRCATVRCGTGTVCVTVRRSRSRPALARDPLCRGVTRKYFPSCQFTVKCVPRAKPKPGFCPSPKQVSQANGTFCQYDNDCASNLLCCPGVSRGGLNCTAPAFPDPCAYKKCPLHAPTCVAGVCLHRVCTPGNFHCTGGKQCFCSRSAKIVCTDVPAASGC